ncbi:MAG: cytochrome b5 domain-containing protein [Hyphomicrobiales bacterium]
MRRGSLSSSVRDRAATRSENRERTRLMSVSSSEPDKPAGQGSDGLQAPLLRRYSRAQLAHHDGSDPSLSVLIAHKNKIYDVTASYPWAKGSHWGDLRAGRDLTGRLKESIHGEEMLSRVPCVGILDSID